MAVNQTTVPLSVENLPARRSEAMLGILMALSVSHMLNDTIQALIPASYLVLKQSYGFTYGQISLISLVFQATSSLLQPIVGAYSDKKPQPYSLAMGMGCTLVGLLLLSQSTTLTTILISASMVGAGSAVFHPEASRLAMLASGGRHGFAQSLFQVGGNFGTSLAPLMAAWILVPGGLPAVAWFSFVAMAAILILFRVGVWYRDHLTETRRTGKPLHQAKRRTVSRGQLNVAIVVLGVLIISKFFYLISLTNYYTFFLIDKFHLSDHNAYLCLFVFQFAVAVGTIAGGAVGDRFGRRLVIWASILGVAPFSILLPYANLPVTIFLSACIGMLIASAFPAILVFAQELLPGQPGRVAGLFFGFAFGMGGIAAFLIGNLADYTSIKFVFHLCAYLPLIGLLTVFLPKIPAAEAVE